ncbi:MAG: hypothetical protein IMY73_02060 [Bacteroidetes bacterium]|nr:hypothetical protein [Bacteroidota bacterium]
MKKIITIILVSFFSVITYAQEKKTDLDKKERPEVAKSSQLKSIEKLKKNRLSLHVSKNTLCLNSGKYGFISGLGYQHYFFKKLYFLTDYTFLYNDVTEDFSENGLVSVDLQEHLFVAGLGYDILKTKRNRIYISMAVGCSYQQFNKEILRVDTFTGIEDVRENKCSFAYSPSLGYSFYVKDYFDVGVNLMGHFIKDDWAYSLNFTVGYNF